MRPYIFRVIMIFLCPNETFKYCLNPFFVLFRESVIVQLFELFRRNMIYVASDVIILPLIIYFFPFFVLNNLYSSGRFLLLLLLGIFRFFRFFSCTKVEISNFSQHERWKIVRVLAIACTVFRIESVTATNNTEYFDIFGQSIIEFCSKYLFIHVFFHMDFA